MILRRFTEHIKEQNWFAVLLDFLVVVLGIYIGLQADAWMADQRDRELEREYLGRLLADMEESIQAQAVNIEMYETAIVATDYVAQIQHSGSVNGIDEENLVEGLNSIGWVPPLVTNMTTIRELQSTGNISLIRNPQLRRAIGEFDRSYVKTQASAVQNLQFVSAAAPEYMTWSYMQPRVAGVHQAATEEEDPSYGYVHQWDAERLLGNPDSANITSWVSGWGKYDAAVRMQHHRDTVAFRDLLKEHLESLQRDPSPMSAVRQERTP